MKYLTAVLVFAALVSCGKKEPGPQKVFRPEVTLEECLGHVIPGKYTGTGTPGTVYCGWGKERGAEYDGMYFANGVSYDQECVPDGYQRSWYFALAEEAVEKARTYHSCQGGK